MYKRDVEPLEILQHLTYDIDGVLRIIENTYQLIQHRVMKLPYNRQETFYSEFCADQFT